MAGSSSDTMESDFSHNSKIWLNNDTKCYIFCFVPQQFNLSQSECGTLSQYVGHETGDRRAVQSHTKLSKQSLDNFMENKPIISLAVEPESEQRTTFNWDKVKQHRTHERCKYLFTCHL